jgi:ADP-heptose:LPS heptosyltransferase
VFPGLKEQGYYTLLYCQETTEEILRHDPNIDRIIRFSSNVPMGELGQLFTWMEKKYKNCRILVETVEGTLLPSPQKVQYHFPQAMRHKVMDFNYLEMHALRAEIPFHPEHQKFYPNDEEKVWANEFRKTLTQYVVVLVPNGSSITKQWPYAGELARYLLRRNDVSVVVLGDLRGCTFEDHPRLHQIGTEWPMRRCMTFAQLANVVVGQETGIVNSVAFESDVRKIVLMTHSSKENLTRDWPNTTAMIGMASCYPCHRLHYDFSFCNKHEGTGAALCQSKISMFDVLEKVLGALDGNEIEQSDRTQLRAVASG